MVRFQRDSCPIQLRVGPLAGGHRIGASPPGAPRFHRRLTVVTKQGRVSAPGGLSGPVAGGDSAATATAEPENTLLPDEPLRELALRYGLKQTAVRPPLRSYAAELWQRRHFISGFATARNVAMYTEARLGQLWQVLTPLLNAGVYYLIFGLLLGTNRGVPNYVSFLVTGDLRVQLHPAGVHHVLPGDPGHAAADPGAVLPPGLPAAGLRADRAAAADPVLRRAVRHHADQRRADHPVLAADHPCSDPAERVQRGGRADPGPLGLELRRRQPAPAVHRADLAVRLRRAVQPASR